MGDVNSDGLSDFAYQDGSVALALGHADGTVDTSHGIELAFGLLDALVLWDANHDGFDDVVLLTESQLFITLGSGDL